ncbi:radical SAM protein [Bacillus thuringiensis]|uniref:radical SAM protein n=1 Tax=Bacillus thuringiensis TaxID=1428 RepID=UPI0016429DF8|nr:radical SAM protein [Bacillus thuringiensis]
MQPAIKSLFFPLHIKWYITGKCNLRCRHCYLTDYTKQMSFERIENFIKYFASKKVRGIGLLGGEPLIRDDLEDIVYLISKENIITKIASNGTLISADRAKNLVQNGCKQYQISLEGHSPEFSDPVRGKGTFEKSLKGASILKNEGAWVSFAVTISKQNAKYIEQIHNLALQAGIDQLKVAAFVPIGTGKMYQESYGLTRDIVVEVRNTLIYLKKKYPQLKIDSKFLPSESINCSEQCFTFGCGAGTSDLIINSDLTLSACDILVEEDKTKKMIETPDDIEYLWNNDSLFNKWRGNAPEERTLNIKDFRNVHRAGCHVAYSTYKEDLFR